MGIEPTPRAWEAPILPLNYTRLVSGGYSKGKWGQILAIPNACLINNLIQAFNHTI